jgi:hypothetical protein
MQYIRQPDARWAEEFADFLSRGEAAQTAARCRSRKRLMSTAGLRLDERAKTIFKCAVRYAEVSIIWKDSA